MNILHRRNIGYLLDACQLITCKSARRETWIDTFVRIGNEEKDLNVISTILDYFDSVNPKMLLLGFRDRKKGSLIGNIFYNYADEYIGNWDTKTFIDYISDINRLKKDVSLFYLDQDYSDQTLVSLSEDVKLSSDLKSILFDFFIFPESYIKLLKDEFSKIFSKLDKYYHDKLSALVEFQESFNYEILLSKDNSPFSKQHKWDKGLKSCYVSFSLISKYTLARGKNNGYGWIVMGYDYTRTFDEMHKKPLDIAAFGNAFGDKIRVKIMELIQKNGEMTLADLSKEIGIVNTIAIYHLDILKKENLLLHRYSGRKVLYCINQGQIELGLDAIKTLCGGTK